MIKQIGLPLSSLRKHPFLHALHRWGRFARRNVSPAAKNEEKLMFFQATRYKVVRFWWLQTELDSTQSYYHYKSGQLIANQIWEFWWCNCFNILTRLQWHFIVAFPMFCFIYPKRFTDIALSKLIKTGTCSWKANCSLHRCHHTVHNNYTGKCANYFTVVNIVSSPSHPIHKKWTSVH